jgi:hypothetical protein
MPAGCEQYFADGEGPACTFHLELKSEKKWLIRMYWLLQESTTNI